MDTLIGIFKAQLLAKDEIKEIRVIFPLKTLPLNHGGDFDWMTNKRRTYFGAYRTDVRNHAGQDLYAKVGEPIYAIADGEVLYAGSFDRSLDVAQVIILHILNDGTRFIVRYCEVANSGYVIKGTKVKQGQRIAEVGQLKYKSGATEPNMLHFEMYSTDNIDHVTNGLFVKGLNKYQRRDDITDPRPILLEGFMNFNKK